MSTIQKALSAVLVIAILGMYFIGRPLLRQKEAVKTLDAVMTNWQRGDYTFNYKFWQDRFKVPPIEKIQSYRLISQTFGERSKNRIATITIEIIFAENSNLPSGKKWKVEMIERPEGWLIENFTLIES